MQYLCNGVRPLSLVPDPSVESLVVSCLGGFAIDREFDQVKFIFILIVEDRILAGFCDDLGIIVECAASKSTKDKDVHSVGRCDMENMSRSLQVDVIEFLVVHIYRSACFRIISIVRLFLQVRCGAADHVHCDPVFLLHAQGKGFVSVNVGCTGGQHRSVYIAQTLYEHYKDKYKCSINHRELSRNEEAN